MTKKAPPICAKAYKESFINQIGNVDSTIQLFNLLTDVYFFMKDRDGKFIAANPLQVEKLGLGREEDIIGKTDYDFFPEAMVNAYLGDDRHVMETRQPLEKKVELVSNPDGSISWHITSKVPIISIDNTVIGVMGFMRDLDKSADHWQPYHQMEPVISYIDQHYQQSIDIESLANLVGLSLSQFEKRFKATFNTTPIKFLIRYRITRSCHDLIHSDRKIIQISIDNGFYDHSHFSREFKRMIGMSPGEYRKRHTQ
jgi:PAS domain S-box-containing protein